MINTLTIILALSLALTVLITAFSVWYSIRLSRTVMYFSENMNDLLDMMTDYSNHVKSVYGLESFYGDQVLHNLLKLSQDIVEQLETFDEILYLTEETTEEGGDMYEQQQEEEIEQETTSTGEEAQEAKNPARVWSAL